LPRFPTLTPEEIMVIAGILADQLLHTRAAQILLDRGDRPKVRPVAGRSVKPPSPFASSTAAAAL
jgi:hypothetical protein